MKLNRQEQLCLDMFHENDNIVTTGMFLKTTLSAEYRKIISRLRNIHGYCIPAPILNKKEPGKNLYTLIEKEVDPKQTILEQCQNELISYPESCPERKKIIIQIENLTKKLRKETACQK